MANAGNRELSKQEHDVIRRYLLDDLPLQEMERVEEQLLTDASYFEQFSIAEDELIDAYVKGRLAGEERKKFSRHFLAVPGLRQDVNFAKALHQRAAEHERRMATAVPVRIQPVRDKSLFASLFQSPAIGSAMAAALVVAIGMGLWLNTQNRQLRDRIEQLQAQASPAPQAQDLEQRLAQARERENSLNAQLEQAKLERTQAEQKLNEALEQQRRQTGNRNINPTPIPAVLLALAGDRDSGEQNKLQKPTTRRINLQIDLPAKEYSSYSAELKTVDGKRILTRNNLPLTTTANGSRVSFIVNTSLLPPGDYLLIVMGKDANGIKNLDTYPFRILR